MTSTEELQNILTRLENIEARNKAVEESKAWEVSGTRKLAILIITYILASLVMYFLGVSNYYSNALIPTLGFYLSTLSLNLIKTKWLKIHKYK